MDGGSVALSEAFGGASGICPGSGSFITGTGGGGAKGMPFSIRGGAGGTTPFGTNEVKAMLLLTEGGRGAIEALPCIIRWDVVLTDCAF